MEQTIKAKNNIKYCMKCGSLIEYGKGVKDFKGNDFCEGDCRNEFWLEIRQDHDDVFREVYGKDY